MEKNHKNNTQTQKQLEKITEKKEKTDQQLHKKCQIAKNCSKNSKLKISSNTILMIFR